MNKVFLKICLLLLLLGNASCLRYKNATKDNINTLKDNSTLTENVKIPDNWILSNSLDSAEVSYDWINELKSPQLLSLIREGINYNADIVIAQERLNQIELSMDIAGSNLYPTVNALANTSNNLVSGNQIQNLGIKANWELDIWGKNKANKMASVSDYYSARYINDRLQQTTSAMIVKAYFLNIAGNMQEDKVKQYQQLTKDIEKLYVIRNTVGTANALDISNIKSELILLNGYLEKIRRANSQSRRTLELLIGRYPEGILETSEHFAPLRSGVPTVFSLTLLENRPDVLARHYLIEKAFYEVQEAQAARLPSLSITSSLGGANANVTPVGSLYSNPLIKVGGSLTTPIFNGGKLKKNVEVKTSQQQQAVEEYSKTVLNALNELESSWANTISIEKQLGYSLEAVSELNTNIELTREQIRIGSSNSFELIKKQRDILKTQMNIIDLELQERIERINLYLALGAPNFEKLIH